VYLDTVGLRKVTENRCTSQDSNWVSLRYMSQASRLEASCAMQFEYKWESQIRQTVTTRFAKRSENEPNLTSNEVKSGWSLWPMKPPTPE
jgi:hypothetical protein